VILATGVTASGEEELEAFRARCEELASEIDLSDVWEVVQDEATRMSLDDLAELHWGPSYDPAQRVALLLHLERSSLYFANENESYRARSQDIVQEAKTRTKRKADNARAEASLVQALSRGTLPVQMTQHQSSLLEHLRGFVIHGDNYTRSAAARNLLEKLDSSTRDLERLGFELLARVGVFSPDEPLELERAGIVRQFSEDVEAEAEAIELPGLLESPRRRDMTAMPALTIDDAGTEDRDDALSLEVEAPRPDHSEKVYRIAVHIADAGTLIPPGGPLDQESDRRMATLYLPELKVTMLPPQLTNRTGSLVAGERRVALSVLARITESATVLDWEVVPSVVRSQEALSYREADEAISNPNAPWHPVLVALNRIALSLGSKRVNAGAINIERPEMMVKVNGSGEVRVEVLPRYTPARMMVAEFMILCNWLLADFCRREGLPAAYRSQSAPDLGDVPAELPEGPLRRYLIMRRFRRAELGTVPAAHDGLGVPLYVQATAPLRRYPDLVMQRQISHFIRSGQPLYSAQEIASVAHRAQLQLKELTRLEEDRKRYWFLKYLHQQISQPETADEASLFRAVVLDNQPRRTALLELADYPFRFRAEVPGDHAPGDTVTLRLHGVDLWRREGQFVHERPE
jgi:exoribonuclease-2